MKIQLQNLNYYLTDNLNRIIADKLLDHKEIVLFGVNSTSHLIKKVLNRHGYKIAAYIDNDKIKCQEMNHFLMYELPYHTNTEIHADSLVKAYAPNEYLCDFREDAVILIASKYYPQMCDQLEKMGYCEGKQILQVVDFYALEKLIADEDLSDYRKLEMPEIRMMQMELMDDVKKTCEQNGLRYFMCGGTLLGAVRHGGYIPWDDDVDLCMPMPDFLKFIELNKRQDTFLSLNIYDYPDDYFNFFMRFMNTSTYMRFWEYPFLMSTGLSIDIFPLFGLPDSKKEREFFCKKIRLLNQRYISTYIENEKDTAEVIELRHSLQREIEAMMVQYPFDESEMIGNVLSKYREKEIMPRTIYDGTVTLSFEDREYAAAAGYKDYLKCLFGDYMKLPPEKDRMNTHSYNAFVMK